jgi:hypothetical protein
VAWQESDENDPPATIRWLAAEEAAPDLPPDLAAPPQITPSGAWSGEARAGNAARGANAVAGPYEAGAAPGADPFEPLDPGGPFDPFELADAALAELFAGQALAAPPGGFADRVLARVLVADTPETVATVAGVAEVTAPRALAGEGRLGGRRRRLEGEAEGAGRSGALRRRAPAFGLAAAAALVAVPFWLPFLLRVLRALVNASTISLALQGAIGAVQGLTQVVAALVSWGNTLFLLAMAVARPLMTPPIAALAAICLTISVLSLRSLHALIQRDRRWVYADPI